MEAEDMDFTPKHLADLIQAVEGGKINQANAKKVFAKILEDDVEPLAYMEKEGLLMVSDSGAIEGAVDQVLAENPKTVEEFHSGKEKSPWFPGWSGHEKDAWQSRPGNGQRTASEKIIKM